MELDRLFTLAIDVADGLDTAPCQGHSSPRHQTANIFVTAHDHAKILDFGLAKVGFALRAAPSDTAGTTQAGP